MMMMAMAMVMMMMMTMQKHNFYQQKEDTSDERIMLFTQLGRMHCTGTIPMSIILYTGVYLVDCIIIITNAFPRSHVRFSQF